MCAEKRNTEMKADVDVKLNMTGAPECVNEVLNATRDAALARAEWIRDLERRVQVLEAKAESTSK